MRTRRQAFGQHFLKSTDIIGAIVRKTLELSNEKKISTLLEVGPGKGAITNALLESFSKSPPAKHFVLVEKDRKLSAYWNERAVDEKLPLEVIDQDFLRVPFDDLKSRSGNALGVVSNLPYSSGTAILLRLLADAQKGLPLSFLVLMFQAEVAQRLRASPGTKAWGSLSLLVQNHWDVTQVIQVPPSAFIPPPKVQSEVILLLPRPTRLKIVDEERWELFVRACFAHRRKMLRSGLSGQPEFQRVLDKSGVSGTERAEALSWEDWEKLQLALFDSKSK